MIPKRDASIGVARMGLIGGKFYLFFCNLGRILLSDYLMATVLPLLWRSKLEYPDM